MRFNPPPNWPAPAPGWYPPPGWEPPAEWGPPPIGWPLRVPDVAPGYVTSTPGSRAVGGCARFVMTSVLVVVVLGGRAPCHRPHGGAQVAPGLAPPLGRAPLSAAANMLTRS